jgi:divalent metal cation (Fe/Co/Zn/Cd) transporter
MAKPCETTLSRHPYVIWLQAATIIWMCVECGVALSASWKSHSPALLAFGSDSLVELLSAVVVLLPFVPAVSLHSAKATRLAGALLFVLAGVVLFSSGATLVWHVPPETSFWGIVITVAALVIMPLLSGAKRKASREINNWALAADAVQSATCAYLAAMTLVGLSLNALLHISWIDNVAALGAVPILGIEARKALRGDPCRC